MNTLNRVFSADILIDIEKAIDGFRGASNVLKAQGKEIPKSFSHYENILHAAKDEIMRLREENIDRGKLYEEVVFLRSECSYLNIQKYELELSLTLKERGL